MNTPYTTNTSLSSFLATGNRNFQNEWHQSENLHPQQHSVAEVQYTEGDLWTLQIILSALEEFVLTNSSNSKFPVAALQLLQNALINLKAELPKNPFVKSSIDLPSSLNNTMANNDARQCTFEASSLSTCTNINNEINKPVLLSSSDISSELKLVIRSMVSVHLRNMAKTIINIYSPLFGKNDHKVVNTKQQVADDEQQILEELMRISELLNNLNTDDKNLNVALEESKTQLNVELENYDKEIKEFQEILSQLLELAVNEKQPDKFASYLDYLRRENENLSLKQEIVQLEQEIESNPPDLDADLQEQFDKLQEAVKKLEIECEEKEKLMNDYNALGKDFINLSEDFKAQEEEIKTKEWVKEQLKNAPLDRSLSESFF